jgi:hypothetical protein
MKNRLLPILIAGAVAPFALVDAASASSVHGTVIKRGAGANVVALASGKLVTVPGGHARVGSVVTVRGSHMRVTGHALRAKIHGVVVRRAGHRFLLADRGAAVAVTSTTPPAPGSEITTGVTINAGALQADGSTVDAAQADGAEFDGTLTAVTPQLLTISVNGVLVPVQVGTVVLPTGIAVGQRVEVRVALSQATGAAIAFALVSIHVDGLAGNEGDHHHGNCPNVEAKGVLTLGTGTLSVATDGGPVTFTVPTGFSLDGLANGAVVEAKGTKNADGTITLVSIQADDGSNCHHGHDGHNDDNGNDDNGNTSTTDTTTATTSSTQEG